MKRHATALLALSLAACGGSGDGARKPTVEMPLAAPAGTNPIIADFVEICSASLYDRDQFLKAVEAKPAWRLETVEDTGVAEQATRVRPSVYIAELESEKLGLQGNVDLRVADITFPHLEGGFCTMNAFDFFDLEAGDLAKLGEIPGFLGDHQTATNRDESGFFGRWSAIGPDGHPVTLQADMKRPGDFVSVTLTTTRPIDPD